MAKVSELRLGTPGTHSGQFRCEKFNLFESRDMERYAELRMRENNAANGVEVEMVREYTRKTVISEGGPEGIVTTQEDVYLVVHYWEKAPSRDKGSPNEANLQMLQGSKADR